MDARAATGHVSIDHVGIRFDVGRETVQAVQDASLQVRPGEFVSLIGPSGCGKSTLLNVVAGFLPPSSGTITLDGAAIAAPGPERGVVFQQYSLFPWMSVRGNVEFGLRMQGVPATERTARARTLLGLAGLLAFATTPTSSRAA